MGVMTPPGGSGEEPNGTITTRPKERQFQVVPVPGVFTRGRWKCCDFREAELIDKGILEFVKPNADVANHNPSTIMVTSVAPVRVETLQKQTQSTPVLAPSLPADASLDSIHSEQASSTLTGLSVADTTTDSVGSSTQPASLTTELPVPAVEVPRHASSTTVNIPVTHKPEFDETNDVSVSQNIDNKIEQAMDLVKSHLTFAVREEVEDLKGTISQLKSKIQLLESQNIILRQFAPSDVVKNLPALIQSQQIPPLKSEPIKERSSRTFVPAQINSIESDQSVPITQQPSLPLPTMSSPLNIDSSSLEPQTLPATSFPSRSICESQPPLPLSSGTLESSTPIDVTQRGSDMVPTQTPHQFSSPSQNTAGISRQYSYPDQSVAAPVQQQFSSPVLESQTLPPQYPPKHNTSERVNAQPS